MFNEGNELWSKGLQNNKQSGGRMSRIVHKRISEIWNGYIQKSFNQAAEKTIKDSLGIKVPETNTPIKSYSGEAVLTIPEEDRVCTWNEEIQPVKEVVGMIYVSYYGDCGNCTPKNLYNHKVEAILKRATYCIFCGKKVKWKD